MSRNSDMQDSESGSLGPSQVGSVSGRDFSGSQGVGQVVLGSILCKDTMISLCLKEWDIKHLTFNLTDGHCDGQFYVST